MKKIKEHLHIIKWIILVNVCLICLWILTYWLTFSIYYAFGFWPYEWIRSIITAFLGFFIFGILINILGRWRKKKHENVWAIIINALKEMSKGNFNVTVNWPHGKNTPGPFSELISNINKMAQDLGQIEKLRQEFISNVSHEIQSPLTSIGGFARALSDDDLSKEDRRHYLSIIEMETQRLSKLSDNLLKLTALESEQQPFEPRDYRLDKQLRHIILSCEPQWSKKDLQLDIDLDEVFIFSDEELMSHVWINLIRNSIKFTEEKGSLSIYLSQDAEFAKICISDTGIGISREDQLHLFERFFKADKSRNRAAGGNGLGLSIVKKIIDMHKGSIEVESELGKGTSFTILVPKKMKYDKRSEKR
ncbi:sensor histidine kinase [Terrilactibacillus laevilacticus]|uniref:histidine kinase n=1 Tax=Terrilactibacillus laevilacticus TaxID=1380157 RepID=A0ABW5PP76_9BACI|nr:HAMP domain-containing sensor histidine kinase [Terrilactibacillus laevilacticus]